MRKGINTVLIIIIILLCGFAMGESIGRIEDLELAKVRPDIFKSGSIHLHYIEHPIITYIHVIAAMVFLITGAYQLIPYTRKQSMKVHRAIGKVFLLISFMVSITGIGMAVFVPFGNRIETLSSLIFGMIILYATIMAYSTIRKKQIIEHSYWVRRIFFLSISVSTIRVVMIITMMATGQSVQEVMGQSFLIGFVLNCLFIELWIRDDKKYRMSKVMTPTK